MINFTSPPINNTDKKFDVVVDYNTRSRHPFIYDLYSNLQNIIEFQDKKILDFGGSWGNLIRSSNGNIKEENYTCLDVDQTALTEGSVVFPNANWLHYNRKNVTYNPNGNDNTKVCDALGDQKFDLIFSYSVFTHMPYEDLENLILELKNHLTSNGKMFISVCLQEDTNLLEWYKQRRIDEFGQQEDYTLNSSYIYIADNKQVTELDKEYERFLVFYNKTFIEKFGIIHSDANIFQSLLEVK